MIDDHLVSQFFTCFQPEVHLQVHELRLNPYIKDIKTMSCLIFSSFFYLGICWKVYCLLLKSGLVARVWICEKLPSFFLRGTEYLGCFSEPGRWWMSDVEVFWWEHVWKLKEFPKHKRPRIVLNHGNLRGPPNATPPPKKYGFIKGLLTTIVP